jgi:1-acyl-sn-glycerol-3-phosphate acyltransferase
MHRTIFSTPVVNGALRGLSIAYLRLRGWQVQGVLPPNTPKCVLIAAPHTSAWDLPYTLMVAFALRLNIYWMGKHSLFRGPFGPVMRWLGGIAVNRETSGNVVAASAAAIVAADGPLQLVVAPAGTRAKAGHWRTGFYHIAQQAKVPIVLAYMDYQRKVSGLGPEFTPTGDVEADMAVIKRFYAGMQGRRARSLESD